MSTVSYVYFPTEAAERFAALDETASQHLWRLRLIALARRAARVDVRRLHAGDHTPASKKAKRRAIEANVEAKLPKTYRLEFPSWRALLQAFGLLMTGPNIAGAKACLDHLCEPLDDGSDEPMPALLKSWRVTEAGEIRIVVRTGSKFWFPERPATSCVKLKLLPASRSRNASTMLALYAWLETKAKFGTGRYGPSSKKLKAQFHVERLRDITDRALPALNARLIALGAKPYLLKLNRADQWVCSRLPATPAAPKTKTRTGKSEEETPMVHKRTVARKRLKVETPKAHKSVAELRETVNERMHPRLVRLYEDRKRGLLSDTAFLRKQQRLTDEAKGMLNSLIARQTRSPNGQETATQ